MKKIKWLLSVLMCILLFTSCKEEETVVNYGFVCSDNLFKFVSITATYTTSKGENNSVEVTPSIMEALNEDGSSYDNSDGSSSTVELLAWRQSKNYDESVEAHLTISFRKKAGIDFSAYEGQIIKITKNAYLNSQYKEKGLTSITSTTSIDLSGILSSSEDTIYGDYLEEYIDKLVSEPIIK